MLSVGNITYYILGLVCLVIVYAVVSRWQDKRDENKKKLESDYAKETSEVLDDVNKRPLYSLIDDFNERERKNKKN